jgi:hypothetical protein
MHISLAGCVSRWPVDPAPETGVMRSTAGFG